MFDLFKCFIYLLFVLDKRRYKLDRIAAALRVDQCVFTIRGEGMANIFQLPSGKRLVNGCGEGCV